MLGMKKLHNLHDMNAKGLTVIELMITVVILSLLLVVAVPGMSRMVINNSVDIDRDTLYSFLLTARSEAITRGTKVSICKSSDLATCDDSLAWAAGWILFSDRGADGIINDDDTIIKVNESLDQNISIAYTGGNHVTFDSVGRLDTNNGIFSFTHSSGDADYNRSVTLSTTGRARKG